MGVALLAESRAEFDAEAGIETRAVFGGCAKQV